MPSSYTTAPALEEVEEEQYDNYDDEEYDDNERYDDNYDDDDYDDDDETTSTYDSRTGENINIRYENPAINFHQSLTEFKTMGRRVILGGNDKAIFKTPYIGTELEVETRSGHSTMEGLLATHHLNWKEQYNYGRFFWYKPDSSLNYGVEIVSHPASLAYWHENYDSLATYATELQKYFKGFHTSSAGGHVHISRNSFTSLHIWKFVMFHNLNKNLIVRVAQRGENHWWEFENDAAYKAHLVKTLKRGGGHHNFSRYRAVNLTNYNTIELRYFKSNINPSRIMKNIEFAHAAWAHTRDMPAWKISNTMEFLAWLYRNRKTYPHLYAFLEEVYNKTLSRIENLERTANHNLKKLVPA